MSPVIILLPVFATGFSLRTTAAFVIGRFLPQPRFDLDDPFFTVESVRGSRRALSPTWGTGCPYRNRRLRWHFS